MSPRGIDFPPQAPSRKDGDDLSGDAEITPSPLDDYEHQRTSLESGFRKLFPQVDMSNPEQSKAYAEFVALRRELSKSFNASSPAITKAKIEAFLTSHGAIVETKKSADVQPPVTASREPTIDFSTGPIDFTFDSAPSVAAPAAEAVAQPEDVQSGPEEFAEEMKAMLSEKLGEEAEVAELTITTTLGGMQVRAELHQGMAGKIELDGMLVAIGNTLGIESLNVKADRFEKTVRKKIEEKLSDFGPALQSHFEKKYGKPISGIRADVFGFTIGFVGPAAAEEDKKPDAPGAAASAETGSESAAEKTPAEIAAENRKVAMSVAHEFEAPLTEDARKSYDPLHRLLKKMEEDPEMAFKAEDAGFEYRVVVPSINDKGEEFATSMHASSYHDMLRLRAGIPEESLGENDRTQWTWKDGSKWGKIATLAVPPKLWKRLDDPNDKLSKYGNEFYALLETVKNEQLPDEYAAAISRGEVSIEKIKEDTERQQNEIITNIQRVEQETHNIYFVESRGRPLTPEEEERTSKLHGESAKLNRQLRTSLDGIEPYESDPLQLQPLSDPDAVRQRIKQLQDQAHALDKNKSLQDFKQHSTLTRQWTELHRKLTEAGESTEPPEIPPVGDGAKVTLDPDETRQGVGAHLNKQRKSSGLMREMAEAGKDLGQFVGEGFTKASGFLKNRSKALGASLRKTGMDVIGDFKLAGKRIAYVATNPMEALRATGRGAERAGAYAKYFTDRSVSLDKKGEKLKVDMKSLIESYNKMPFRYKAYITTALISGSALTAAAGLPSLAKILASGMYGVRALGSAGFALNRRKGMDSPESLFEGMSNVSKNIYAGVFTAAYLGATSVAGHYAIENMTRWLGNIFGHGASIATEVASPPTSGTIPRPPSYSQEVFQKPLPEAPTAADVAAPAPAAAAAPEAPAPAVATPAGESAESVRQFETGGEHPTRLEAKVKLQNVLHKFAEVTGEKPSSFEMPKHADFSIHEDDTTISPYDVTPTDQSGAEEVLSPDGVEEQIAPAESPEQTPEIKKPVAEPIPVVEGPKPEVYKTVDLTPEQEAVARASETITVTPDSTPIEIPAAPEPPAPPVEAVAPNIEPAPEPVAPSVEAPPVATSEAPELFTKIDGSLIDPKVPAIYEATDPVSGKLYMAAYGGTDEERFKFIQDYVARPENEGKSVRWAHTVKSMFSSVIKVDEIGANTEGGRTSQILTFFTKEPAPPSPDTFLRRLSK